MPNRSRRVTGLEVALRNIRHVLRIMNEDMVPGLILWRPGLRHGIVPLVRVLKRSIDVDNDAPIAKPAMGHHLTDRKLCRVRAHLSIRRQSAVTCRSEPSILA